MSYRLIDPLGDGFWLAVNLLLRFSITFVMFSEVGFLSEEYTNANIYLLP